MWRVVQQTAHRQWSWIVMDAQARQVMAFQVGDRSRDRATALWAQMPPVYREHATFHTAPYDAYTGGIPAERHQAITITDELAFAFGSSQTVHERTVSGCRVC